YRIPAVEPSGFLTPFRTIQFITPFSRYEPKVPDLLRTSFSAEDAPHLMGVDAVRVALNAFSSLGSQDRKAATGAGWSESDDTGAVFRPLGLGLAAQAGQVPKQKRHDWRAIWPAQYRRRHKEAARGRVGRDQKKKAAASRAASAIS
ncbi:hypothetical protein, partial [Agrobacterium tumefaciens]|uniref:hypothetical protein n=1 Tax=Agrobacterium tumefaciens TaxID=358 RepID=UPI002FDAB417